MLVSFDPATHAPALAAFQAKYGSAIFADPYQGRLDNVTEALEPTRPDAPQEAPHPDAGFVPTVLVDRVVQAGLAPWPTAGRTNTASALVPPSISVPPASRTVITGDPTGLTVLENGPATFTVSATGTEPLSYQWQKNGLNLPVANAARFTLPAAQASDEGGSVPDRAHAARGWRV